MAPSPAAQLMAAYTVVVNVSSGATCGSCRGIVVAPEEGTCEHCGVSWMFVAATYIPSQGLEYLASLIGLGFPKLRFIGVAGVPALTRDGELRLMRVFYPDGWREQRPSVSNSSC